MFGGLAVTIMDKDSPTDSAGGTFTTAPYQPQRDRLLFTSKDLSTVKTGFYSGGFAGYESTFDGGGYWANEAQGRALSWTNRWKSFDGNIYATIFIGGKYSVVSISAVEIISGCLLDKASLVAALPTIDFAPYKYVAGLLVKDTSGNHELRLYGCQTSSTAYFNSSNLQSTSITLSYNKLSGFNAAGQLAVLINNLAGFEQTVNILTPNASFSALSSATAYSKTTYKLHTAGSTTTISTTPLHAIATQTVSLVAGDPVIFSIVADGAGFAAIRQGYSAFSSVATGDEYNVGAESSGAGYIHNASTLSASMTLDSVYIQSGSAPLVNAVFNTITLAGSSSDAYDKDSAGNRTIVRAAHTESVLFEFHFASAKNNLFVFTKTNRVDETSSSTDDSGGTETLTKNTIVSTAYANVGALTTFFSESEAITETYTPTSLGPLPNSVDGSTVFDSVNVPGFMDSYRITAHTSRFKLCNIGRGTTGLYRAITLLLNTPDGGYPSHTVLAYRIDGNVEEFGTGFSAPVSVTQNTF